ncbi:hypothetical protein ACQPZ2_30355 [Nocardia pseudovaccinii]|uniref:hypothetical protein n=1 Tax=Nocardia pseudovaccinii TaxID=189540 RepID=UPI003D93A6C3
MVEKSKRWRDYEEVTEFLLDRLASELGLARVEGKQRLVGEVGTPWEVDAKGVRLDDEQIILVECKRYPKKRVNQDTLGGFAYRIRDLGAAGGILVSPLGLQAGADLVAKKEGIVEVHLDANSTREQYVLQFLDKIFVGVHLKVEFTLTATARVGDDPEG